jgi:hypothetical protein
MLQLVRLRRMGQRMLPFYQPLVDFNLWTFIEATSRWRLGIGW